MVRPMSENMVDEVHLAALNESTHWRFSEHYRKKWTTGSAIRWLRVQIQSGSRVYAMYSNGERVGTFTLRSPQKSTIDISFLIYPWYSGKGYASKILETCLRLLDQSTQISTIQLGCRKDNLAMIRVAQKFSLTRTTHPNQEIQVFMRSRTSQHGCES